jgi:peptidoglycan biosynthesis protein MviN/MurJ (putative lipid II flippase)
MPVYFARDAMTRVFYAFQDAHTPLYITIQGIALKAFFNWLLILELPKRFPSEMAYLGLNSVSGICLGSVLATAINLVALSWISRRFISGLGVAALLDNLWRLTLAALAMSTVMILFKLGLDRWAWPDWLQVTLGTSIGCLVYAMTAWLLRVPELQYLMMRLSFSRDKTNA